MAGKVQSAAQAGEELARTIAHVGTNAAQSSRLAAEAVSEAERTSSTIDEMASVANEIGRVTELISAIAGYEHGPASEADASVGGPPAISGS